MCNFAAGECLAIAEADNISGRLNNWNFPGKWELIPLVPEGLTTYPTSGPGARMRKYVFIHMTGIPDGLEVLAVSKLSAALHELIAAHRAVVELNLSLTIAAQPAGRRHDQLSPQAFQLAQKLRRYFSQYPPGAAPARAIGLLDSGIALSSFTTGRQLKARDYAGPRSRFGNLLEEDHDVRGHGTEVCRILDAILPDEVPIVSGRITPHNARLEITVLRVATAFAHLVAAEGPTVVNLSLAPRDDQVICPKCRHAVPVDAFHSLILPFVFRLAGDTTLTVMAAGNRGQVSNARHALAETNSLVLVEAADSTGELASYSNRVDAGHAAAVRAFGGDDGKEAGGITVFENAQHTYGTSYAAPFVSAVAYAYRAANPGARFVSTPDPAGYDFGSFAQQKLNMAIDYRPSVLADHERINVHALA
jgi:hypothetical protein